MPNLQYTLSDAQKAQNITLLKSADMCIQRRGATTPKFSFRFIVTIIFVSLGTHAISIAQRSNIIDQNSIQSKKEGEGRIGDVAATPNSYPAEFPGKSYQLAEVNFDAEKGIPENVKKSMRTFITMHPSGNFDLAD